MLMTCPLKTAKRSQDTWPKRTVGHSTAPTESPQILKKLYKAVYKGALYSRIQSTIRFVSHCHCGRPARGDLQADFRSRFGLTLKTAAKTRSPRPSVGVKHIDSKRALKGFTARFGCPPDLSDLISRRFRNWRAGKRLQVSRSPARSAYPRFALTDRAYSLDSACRAVRC